MFIIRLIKLLIGVLLLPACVAATIVFREEVWGILRHEVYFFAGLFVYLLLLAVFQQPIRTYIFGHELTHVLWVWLFGGSVKGFKAASSGGRVRATKANFLIFLAPYFFPLYSVIAIAFFYLISLFVVIPAGMKILSFVLGFTWAFHITFTIYVLVQGQPDVWATGRVFSLPFIYVTNILVLAALIVFVSPRISFGTFFQSFWREGKSIYALIWVSGPPFCAEKFTFCREHLLQFFN